MDDIVVSVTFAELTLLVDLALDSGKIAASLYNKLADAYSLAVGDVEAAAAEMEESDGKPTP